MPWGICFVRGMRPWLFVLCSLVMLIACTQTKAPTLKSERSEVLDDDKTGMVIRVYAAAHNPNSFAVPIQGARGTVLIENLDTGDATVTSSSTLAPNAETPVVVDVKVPWRRVAYAVGKARPESVVRYEFKGTATLELEGKTIDLPIEQSGQVDKKKVFLAALRHIGLPKNLKPSPRLHSE